MSRGGYNYITVGNVNQKEDKMDPRSLGIPPANEAEKKAMEEKHKVLVKRFHTIRDEIQADISKLKDSYDPGSQVTTSKDVGGILMSIERHDPSTSVIKNVRNLFGILELDNESDCKTIVRVLKRDCRHVSPVVCDQFIWLIVCLEQRHLRPSRLYNEPDPSGPLSEEAKSDDCEYLYGARVKRHPDGKLERIEKGTE